MTNKLAEVDEVAFQQFIDETESSGEIAPDFRVEHLQRRLEACKTATADLVLQLQEAEETGRQSAKAQVLVQLRENYRSRVWLVRQLRDHGVEIQDRTDR